jgi:capsular exopolysaccharide synthesis family protein
MGKIHEVLEKAERDYYRQSLAETIEKPAAPILTGSRKIKIQTSALEPYDNLKSSLLSRYPAGSVKSILFNGIFHGGGCTMTAVNFATALSGDPTKKVLLIDVNLRTPNLHDIYKDQGTAELADLVAEYGQVASRIQKVGSGNLYVVSCGGGSIFGPLGLFESSEFEAFLNEVYDIFDHLILDAPPVLMYSECKVLHRMVDGVVLVFECGKVRKQVALRAKKELEDAGARILGVVLNKRKYYIPKWLYKRL